MVKIKDFEVKYYEKGTSDVKRTIIEATTRQEARDEFKELYPNKCPLGIKRVTILDVPNGEDKELDRMERGICEAEKAYTE